MTLLSKASLVATPTAYGDGVLNSVKPVVNLGSELVTNGGFDTDSDWTKGTGWTITGGKAVGSATSASLYQATGGNYVSGRTYRIQFTVSNYVSGSVRPEITNIAGDFVSSNGTFVQDIVATSSAIGEELKGNAFTGSIDNVSVKEVIGADFDFARASSATRVNEQGLIEKERENVLLQSNTFDTTWLNQLGGTITGGQSGYDGSSDAWLISKDTSTFRSVRQVVSWSGVSTFSVYAKSGSLSNAALRMDTGAGAIQILFDLNTGTPTYSSGILIDYGTQNVGNGWWRLYITVNVSSGTNVHIYADRNGTTAGNIYIQDAQLEQGLVATDYIETTTSSVAVGITNNIPRINYENGIGNFLLEPQRTNLITHSEDFTNASWTKTGTTSVSANDTISPDGTQNASTISGLTGSGSNDLYFLTGQNPASKTYSFSAYLKGSGSIRMRLSNNVDDGGDIFVTLTDDWVRYEIQKTFNATSGNLSATFDDNGGTATSFKIYGAQLEEGSYATSYIPTYGSSVTRAAETCNNAGNSDLFNDSEGVLYAEISALADDLTFRDIAISDGTGNNRVFIYYSTTSNQIVGRVRVSNVDVALLTYTLTDITNYTKIALKYKANDFALWIDGIERATDTSGGVFGANTLTTLAFDAGEGSNDFYGKTKMVSTFTEALSDSELECLTSWSSFNRMATAQNYTIE